MVFGKEKSMKNYILEKKYFDNVTEHQLNEMIRAFKVADNGDLIIPYSYFF